MSALEEAQIGPAMEAQVELVTPAKAMDWLQNAARNRHVSDSTVRRYGSDMLGGRWTLNGQGIIFDANGKLVDGRHRLTAIVATNCEVTMLVVRGAPPEAFETMDSGRTRTLAHTLAIEGHKNTGATSATARITWAYAAGVNLKYGATRTELLNLIRAHPMIEEYTTTITNRDGYAKPMGVPRSALASILALANDARKLDDQVAAFLEGFLTGEGLFAGDPRLTLRRWLARQRAETGYGGTRISEPFFAATSKAWSAYVMNRQLKEIRLPSFFNRETLPIEGFKSKQFGDVPDMARYSFAALGPEPLQLDDKLADWVMGPEADDPSAAST
jgi:hypothetical protein